MVVAFHSGLPFPGGFLGVDVFFVISGFVITAMLQREWASTGKINFGRFYLRRFKRLTPALAVTVGVTLVASALVLSPLGPQQTAAKTGAGAMLLTANQVIASVTGDYFDAPAESNPLLHTWSLSVEEQFYILFPAILALGWLLARRNRTLGRAPVVTVTAVAVASFGATMLGVVGYTGPGAEFAFGFYGPLSRAWEFAAGALLALLATTLSTPSVRRAAPALAVVGTAALIASLFVIPESATFPGPWTLLPVTGTLLLLLTGADGTGLVTRALAARPMVKLGDWSYSLYLWHWPLIVFATLLWPQSDSAPLIAAVLSFLPALASYRWVEEPLRNMQFARPSRGAVTIASVVATPLLIAISVGAVATSYWTPKYESGDVAVAHEGDIGQDAFHEYVDRHYYPCTAQAIRDHAVKWKDVVRCHQSRPGTDVDVALLGDSHAEQLFVGLAEALPHSNVAYYIVNALPTRADPDFARILDHVTESPAIKVVVLTAYWVDRGVPIEPLLPVLQNLSGAQKAVFVTDDVPSFPFDPFGCKYRKAFLLPTECSRDVAPALATYSSYYPLLRAMTDDVKGHLINTTHYFCGVATCDMTRGDVLMYRDSNHLNLNGSRFVGRQMVKDNPELRAAAELHLLQR